MAELNGYELSKNFFDWTYDNSECVSPVHVALYFFCIDLNNRLGWKEKFGVPTEVAMEAIGVKNYKTFSKVFNDLINWNFIKIVQRSKNQYTANVIALVKNTKANTKALSKASSMHSRKQVLDTTFGTVGIDKLENKEEPKNERTEILHTLPNFDIEYFRSIGWSFKLNELIENALDNFLKYRKRHPDYGPVKTVDQLEAIVREIGMKRIAPETFEKMVNYTISKGAKNIIFEVGKATEAAVSTGPKKYLSV